MRRPPHLSSALTLLLAASLVAGCAAYRKCGLSGCPGDADIRAGVEAALAKHADLCVPRCPTVQSLDGVVYLSGTLATELQRDDAGSVAMRVQNVKRVVNNIGVENGAL
jgi:osmotically-inducible protein OsmY